MNWAIELTGSGLNRPSTFTYEQLVQMDMTRLDDVTMLQTHGPDKKVTCAGPPLGDLLAAAEIKPGEMTVALEAADGYKKHCPLEDLRAAIIALQDEKGRWLAEVDRDCPLQLTPPHMPGDFWIKNLQRITVEPAGDS
ncbi:MAG: molybdopterin-dependent oxidoreductase [Phycisphaerales bacterium]|nr:MAG: molybdopterin-dependent oxidoreductase [Phycisphaerales bacterium]